MIRTAAAALAAWAALGAVPASAQSILDRCTAQTCKARLTAAELLGEAQALVAAQRYAEARPMLAALATVPSLKFETRFLTAFVAAHTGDYHAAEAGYRAILADDPGQTRVRLELGRTLLLMGHNAGADHQFRLAQNADDLPPEVARTIRGIRQVIRSKRAWKLNFDVGLAPDTNINNATSAETVNVMFGDIPIPLTLSPSARARSGTGQTGTLEAGAKIPLASSVALLIDANGAGANYAGKSYDDVSAELALGPEWSVSPETSLSLEGVAARRWFGGSIVSRQAGAKLGFETTLGDSQRLGLQLDARHNTADFDHNYDGWQVGAYASYEHVVARSLIASATLFARRDALVQPAYSSVEAGLNLGIGGELPFGFNLGLSGGASRAFFDAPIYFFSPDARRDWRYTARATLGMRKLRFVGFSPQVSWSLAKIDSSLAFYRTSRSRFRFSLARYF